MKKRTVCLLLALLLCFSHTTLAADGAELPLTLETTRAGVRERQTVSAGETEDGWELLLTPPVGCILPATVTVLADGAALPEGDWTYEPVTGRLLLARSVGQADVVVKADFPWGTVMVNGKAVYRGGQLAATLPAGVSYTPETQTLTLDNAVIDRVYESWLGKRCGIYTDLDGLTIQLRGSSSITVPRSVGDDSYGIYAAGSLRLQKAPDGPDGALTITAADVEGSGSSIRSCGIFMAIARTPVTIEDITLTVAGGAADSAMGIGQSYGLQVASAVDGWSGLQIKNSRVDLSCGPVTAGTYGTAAGLSVSGMPDAALHIGSSTVRASGGTVRSGLEGLSCGAELAGRLLVTDGSLVSAQGEGVQSSGGTAAAAGLHSLSPVTVEGASLTASAGAALGAPDTDSGSGGIFAEKLTVDRAAVTLSGADSAFYLLDGLHLSGGSWSANGGAFTAAPFVEPDDLTRLDIRREGDFQPAFSDLTPHQAEAVAPAVERGLFAGTAPDRFSPESTLTRAQAVTVLWRLAGEPRTAGQAAFADVAPDGYYAPAAAWAQEQGIVTGVGHQTFAPDRPVTRQQLAAMLWRYAKQTGRDVSVGESTNILSYADAFAVSEYAVPAIQWACGGGILPGTESGELRPQAPATRLEAAQLLANYLTK